MIAFLPHLFLLSHLALASSLPQPDHDHGRGFSVELIHRDSPKSPFYNSSKAPSQTLSPQQAKPPLRTDVQGADYNVVFQVGTPPVEITAILDTGSDLTWTQCQPCDKCYHQQASKFDPRKSSTYRKLSCDDRAKCLSVPDNVCNKQKGKECKYQVGYLEDGGNSYSLGDIATETMRFPSTSGQYISFVNTVWGCGYNNTGVYSQDQMGVFGLGPSPASFIVQKGSDVGGQKFSYCLAATAKEMSTLHFGTNAVVSGPDVLSTPFIKKNQAYYVTLEAISVGRQRFPFQKQFQNQANAAVDSGTTITYLPDKVLYSLIKSAVQKAISVQPAKSEPLCYDKTAVFQAPVVTLHFRGADMKLTTVNSFYINADLDKKCLAFEVEDADNEVLIGNNAQKNFLVGYDLDKDVLSFKSTDCSKLNK